MLLSLAMVFPRYVHIGHVFLPVFGIVAVSGLTAAMLLSERTAELAGLDTDRMWSAAVFGVVAAFVISRALLVLANVGVFATHPWLVLLQPSFSLGGLLLTTLPLLLWLRWRRLPLLRVMDAWAAPAVLLAAALQAAHFLEGTDAGLPTSLPWGVRASGALAGARVHPVQLYAAFGELALTMWLVSLMRHRALQVSTPGGNGFSRAEPLSARGTALAAQVSLVGPIAKKPGRLAARAMVASGTLSFFVGFLRQPESGFTDAWLDPAQYAALIAIAVGFGLRIWLYAPPPPLTRD